MISTIRKLSLAPSEQGRYFRSSDWIFEYFPHWRIHLSKTRGEHTCLDYSSISSSCFRSTSFTLFGRSFHCKETKSIQENHFHSRTNSDQLSEWIVFVCSSVTPSPCPSDIDWNETGWSRIRDSLEWKNTSAHWSDLVDPFRILFQYTLMQSIDHKIDPHHRAFFP